MTTEQFQFGTWYPISTLKMDGRSVLLGCAGGVMIAPATPMRDLTREEKLSVYKTSGTFPNFNDYMPTHWMPSPEPPPSPIITGEKQVTIENRSEGLAQADTSADASSEKFNCALERYEMTKIVYNGCYGGLDLSDRAVRRYAEIKGLSIYVAEDIRFGFKTYWLVPEEDRTGIISDDDFYAAPMEARIESNKRYNELILSPRDIARTDPALVRVVEELGDAANGDHAELKIAEVPVGTRYRVDEYDGSERVMTIDDYDWSIA